MVDRFPKLSEGFDVFWLSKEQLSDDKTIIIVNQLLNSVVAKYHDLSVFYRSVICLGK